MAADPEEHIEELQEELDDMADTMDELQQFAQKCVEVIRAMYHERSQVSRDLLDFAQAVGSGALDLPCVDVIRFRRRSPQGYKGPFHRDFRMKNNYYNEEVREQRDAHYRPTSDPYFDRLVGQTIKIDMTKIDPDLIKFLTGEDTDGPPPTS